MTDPALDPSTARRVEELVAAMAAGATPRWLFFWGHQPQPDGSVGRGCLSQWWPATFEADGETFASAEHYMMWCKARLFGDDEAAARVLQAGHPRQAKTIGRTVAGFDEARWDAECFEIVVAGNLAKFGQNPPLRQFLVATGPQVLVEASPLDRVWGIGLEAADPDAEHPVRWRGRNLLGFALMQARARLAEAG